MTDKPLGAARGRPTILIIDDEPDILTVYQQRLSASGYEVVTATDGHRGLRAAKQIRPDLILLDVMMPARSGIEVLSDIRQDPNLKETKVLMLTAKSDIETVRLVAQLGISGYLLKTTEPRKLVAKINEVLPLGKAPAPAPPVPAPKPKPAPAPAPKEPEPEPAFSCTQAMRDLLPEHIAMIQLDGSLGEKHVPDVAGEIDRQIGRGYKKLIVDLTSLKWTFMNAQHLKDLVDGARAAGADVRILAPDPEIRQSTLRHRVQASIQGTMKDVLDGF